jgi:pimeloyl-ACP methyl ester carboxylesterase
MSQSTQSKLITHIEVPVDDAAGKGSIISGQCYAPDLDAAKTLPSPIWLYCIPGAGCDRRIYDLHIPGHENEPYSFAEFMTDRGVGIVAVDPLGCGASTFPFDGREMTHEMMSLAHHAAALEVKSRLSKGELFPEVPPFKDGLYGGLGHSAGSGTIMHEQGMLGTYDAIVLLSLPANDFQFPAVEAEGENADDELKAIKFNEQGMAYIPVRPAAYMNSAHSPQTPKEVYSYAFPVGQPFAPAFAKNMINGFLAPFAEKVTCPVLTGFGEFDLARTPLQEPSRFASEDATVYIQPGAYHNVFAEPTRLELWTNIFNWLWARAKYQS